MKLVACNNCGSSISSDAVYCSKCGRKYPSLRALCPFCESTHVTVFMQNNPPAVIGRDGREPLPAISDVLAAARFGQLKFLCTSCSSGWNPNHEETRESFHRAEPVAMAPAKDTSEKQTGSPAKRTAAGRFRPDRLLPRWAATALLKNPQRAE